jgi:TctA family transporter
VFEAVFSGLLQVFTWPTFGLMLIGIAVGFWVGILPGIGGATTLALMLPFIFSMTPVGAFAFLLGMISVTATTGDITSVLFAVPGEATAAATILDGHPMAKMGQAGRALGIVLFSSLVGSIFGALVLALSIPIVRPLVLSFGSPELFMLTIMAISFIGALSSKSMLKGMLMGGLGFLLSMIGTESQTAQLRYTFGLTYLWDGLSIVPVVVGLFGIPEVIDMAIKRSSIAEASMERLAGVTEGIKDIFRHWALTLRCSAIGAIFGILPGIGSGVGQWVVYAHAKQSSKNEDLFGKGAVEGVIGPGAANNASMAAALIPTVAFGIPGGTAMAVLLGAFQITGLVPGPDMLTKHLALTFSMFWVVIVANVITVLVSLLFVNQIAKVTLVKGTILIPLIVFLIYLGGFTAHNSFGDLVVVVIFGLLGALMVWLDWPRPPLVLGLVLGDWAENYLYISTERYGASWLSRPLVIPFLLMTVAAIVYPLWRKRRGGVSQANEQ